MGGAWEEPGRSWRSLRGTEEGERGKVKGKDKGNEGARARRKRRARTRARAVTRGMERGRQKRVVVYTPSAPIPAVVLDRRDP